MTRWAQLGKVGDDFAEKSRAMLRRMGPYSTREINGQVCFGLRLAAFKDSTMLSRTPWADSRSPFPTLRFLEHLPGPALKDIDRFHIPEAKLRELPQILSSHEGVKRFERVQRVVFYSSIGQLGSVLRETLLPAFFHWYPDGLWYFGTANRDFHIALAVLRVLGGTIELADRDYDQLQSLGPFKMMTGAQTGGVFYGSKHLSIPFMIFLPAMYGFVASKVVLSFAFLLDEPIQETRTPFPRSGLEFFRSDSSGLFRQDLDIDVEKVTPKDIDTFRLIAPSFGRDEIRNFIDHYFTRLNGFLTHMVDPAEFIHKDSGAWSGLVHYRAWLAFERLTDEVIFLLTDDSPYLRKMATFRILDQLSSLRTDDSRRQSETFRDLLLPPAQTDPVEEGLNAYPGAVGDHLRHLLKATRSALRDEVVSGIYVPGIYDASLRKISLPDGTVLSPEQYVTGVVRELRNTYHGYHTQQFERYLLINTGSTPESLPAIAVLAYLALIARPDLFLTRAWQ